MIRTVTLTADTEMHVSLGIGDHVSITNKSATASLYAAAASDVVAGEDGVIEIAAGMNSLLPDCKGEVYLLSSDAAEVQLISTNALNANFNKAARGGESGENYVDLSSNQTIGGEKTFTKGVYAVDGVFASGYTQTSLPTDIEGVAMYKSGAISRIAALIKSAASVITYKALALGAYVGGKYSAMFNANGTVDFNFDVTVPTQTAGDSTTKVATTAFTQTAVNNKTPYVGTTAPTNTDLLWRDTSVSPAVLKQYDGSAWVEVGGGGFVTGIMTANGTVTLGFQPSSVFVFAHTFSYNSSDGNRTLARNFAFATYGHPQNVTAVGETLVITSTGFTTTSMFGNAAAEPSASYPLKYIAFK